MACGWLTKEGGRYKTWKRRYTIIETSNDRTDISYYKRENKKEKCGFVPLTGVGVSVTKVGPVEYKTKKYCFEIVSPERTYYFCTHSDSDRQFWINAINAIVNPLAPPLPVPTGAASEEQETNGENTLSIGDFNLLKVIGQGSFGKVLLVSKKEEPNKGKVFAMKVLNKSTIIARNEVEHTKSEKSILMKLEFPFLVKLHYSFQTPDKLYFVMDYINGGELFYHLQKEKKFSEERVRFYAAEIVAGLEYLHTAGVIYRDLKPENLLLTNEGHIVMTDFGLSKEGLHDKDDRTGTFCGTPEYLAPEILEGKGYGKAVDWWSFGTLLYEMLTGLPPFYSEDVQEMYTKIMSAELIIPETMSQEAGSFLTNLLERNDNNRLQEPAKIKAHAFFKEIDWDLLLQKKVIPPFIPKVHGEDDTSNIDPSFTQCPLDNDEEDTEAVSAAAQGEFEGFTYNPNAPKF